MILTYLGVCHSVSLVWSGLSRICHHLSVTLRFWWNGTDRIWGRKKKKKNTKHINILLTALAGQSSQGRIPTRPMDKWDKMPMWLWNSTDNGQFVPGTGTGLSKDRVPLVPDTLPVCPEHRPSEMFMFIGFSCPKNRCLSSLLEPFDSAFVHHKLWDCCRDYINRDRKNHDSQTFDRILRFFSAWKSGNFLHILGRFLTNLHRKPGEKRKKSAGEHSKDPMEIADFCPLSWSNASWIKIIKGREREEGNMGIGEVRPKLYS